MFKPKSPDVFWSNDSSVYWPNPGSLLKHVHHLRILVEPKGTRKATHEVVGSFLLSVTREGHSVKSRLPLQSPSPGQPQHSNIRQLCTWQMCEAKKLCYTASPTRLYMNPTRSPRKSAKEFPFRIEMEVPQPQTSDHRTWREPALVRPQKVLLLTPKTTKRK